jgi:hypothetical protein
VANGATGVSCVALASGAKDFDVVNGLRPVVRDKLGDGKEADDKLIGNKRSLVDIITL